MAPPDTGYPSAVSSSSHTRKAELRTAMRALRRGLPAQERATNGERVAEHVVGLPEVAAAGAVLLYVSVGGELPTRTLFDELRARGIAVAVPRIAAGALEARGLDRWEDLVPGAYRIPTSDGPQLEVDAAVVPGTAFTREGARLGMGGGYYDRWLEPRPGLFTAGVAHPGQLVRTLPLEPHDRALHAVVTPTEVWRPRDPARVRVVAAAVLRAGRVLAARRGRDQARPGSWELPGGKVEAGEPERVALRRELSEELGIDSSVGSWLAASEHSYPDLCVRLDAYAVHTPDEPVATEHDELRWLAAPELDTVPWAPADRPLLEAVRARLGAAAR